MERRKAEQMFQLKTTLHKHHEALSKICAWILTLNKIFLLFLTSTLVDIYWLYLAGEYKRTFKKKFLSEA